MIQMNSSSEHILGIFLTIEIEYLIFKRLNDMHFHQEI
jgi:hypothetical protein